MPLLWHVPYIHSMALVMLLVLPSFRQTSHSTLNALNASPMAKFALYRAIWIGNVALGYVLILLQTIWKSTHLLPPLPAVCAWVTVLRSILAFTVLANMYSWAPNWARQDRDSSPKLSQRHWRILRYYLWSCLRTFWWDAVWGRVIDSVWRMKMSS